MAANLTPAIANLAAAEHMPLSLSTSTGEKRHAASAAYAVNHVGLFSSQCSATLFVQHRHVVRGSNRRADAKPRHEGIDVAGSSAMRHRGAMQCHFH